MPSEKAYKGFEVVAYHTIGMSMKMPALIKHSIRAHYQDINLLICIIMLHLAFHNDTSIYHCTESRSRIWDNNRIDDWLQLYSCLMVVAGLILAAFSAWKLSVNNEIRSTMKPESKNIQGVMLAL